MALPSSPSLDAPYAAADRGQRRWRLAAALLLGLLAVVMMATVLDYGMTGDEGVQHRYARRVLRWYATMGGDSAAAAEEDISMYGGLFEALAEGAASLSPLDPYDTRHIVNVVFALGAFGAALGMGWHLAGPPGGLCALTMLVLTPPFYGHAFNNPKDIPFAATFAVAVWVILLVSDRSPRLRCRDVLAVGLAIGATAGVRVAGIALFGFALVLWAAVGLLRRRDGQVIEVRRDAGRLVASWAAVVVLGWAVMVAAWPWAQMAPIRNPLRALGAFSRFWETMIVFYDGAYVANGVVSRWYLPTWFALTMPETYLLAALLGLLRVRRLRRARPLAPETRVRLAQAGWLALVAVVPAAWAVVRHTPLYDGMRHFLFVVPILAVLAGVSVASFLRAAWGRWEGRLAAFAVAALFALTVADMIALHPYQALYFNRLVAGGLRGAASRYETDYWCLSYKEGAEWLIARYPAGRCTEKVRVAGHSILLQTSYYLKKDPEVGRLFTPVSVDDDPHFVLATTRFGDHLRTPGRVVHTVERKGATLLYVFEVRPPACVPGD
jgi:hypothetical protein